jgi:hypothetical protein
MELTLGRALVAEQAGGYFAPVPPLPNVGESFAAACAELLERLNQLNGRRATTRIERLSDSQRQALEAAGSAVGEAAGLACRPQGGEYLYDRQALAELRGDRYKSQRWNCNQAARRFQPHYEPYRPDDLVDCLRLYAAWRRLKERRELADEYAAALMADSFYAHWQALAHADAWELIARVVRVDGQICAYTIGAPLDDRTMLVLHEIADPACPGLGPWIFREWCREFTDYAMINAMDDSDLSSLRAVKKRNRPLRMVVMHQATL